MIKTGINPIRFGSGSDVDWITATTVDQKSGYNWLEMFNKHRNEADVRTVRMHGFVGLASGGLIWATREKDRRYMMIASGLAAEKWLEIGRYASKITRLDLAVDCWLTDPKPDLIRSQARVFLSPAWDVDRIKRRVIRSTGGGSTLYLGSRNSQIFCRLYDKGIESKTCKPGKWLRYEVEMKHPLSEKIYTELAEINGTGSMNAVHGRITHYTWDAFHHRYVPPLFTPSGEGPSHLRSLARIKTSTERKIAWLRSQVRPTVAYLFEIGLGEEVIDAIGLENCIPTDSLLKLRQAAKTAAKNHQRASKEIS